MHRIWIAAMPFQKGIDDRWHKKRCFQSPTYPLPHPTAPTPQPPPLPPSPGFSPLPSPTAFTRFLWWKASVLMLPRGCFDATGIDHPKKLGFPFLFFFLFCKGIDVRESETDFEQLNWAILTNFYPIMFSRSHSAVQPFFHGNSIIQSLWILNHSAGGV